MTICCGIGDTRSDKIIFIKDVAENKNMFLQWKRGIEPQVTTVNYLDDP